MGAERCLVLHPNIKTPRADAPRRDPHARLEEASGLAAAIGLDVIEAEVVTLAKLKPGTLFGGGAVDRLAALIKGLEITVCVVDGQLTPVQQRNLEKAWACKVIDRTGLILEIFGERARTREGQLQVELAALTFARSRLVRSWTHLERQRGGLGFVGGPGETQIEIDRRLIGERIAKLKKELKEVSRTRGLHRRARQRVPYPVIALVGYTNAGKSTLFNRLTRAEVMAKDQLFATLDPTMRALDLPSGRRVILSDTVGFISDLPHELVNAFHATLEEVCEADIILHVRDSAHPDSEAQKRDVEQVLTQELDLEQAMAEHMLEVLNKTDLLPEAEKAVLDNRAGRGTPPMVPLSAVTGEGCDELLAALDSHLARQATEVAVELDHADGETVAWLYRHGEVVEREDGEEGTRLTVRLDPANLARWKRRRGEPLD